MESFIAAVVLLGFAESVPEERSRGAAVAIWEMAEYAGEDPYMVAAVAWVESRLREKAKSPSDCGILQVCAKYSAYSCDELMTMRIGLEEGIRKLQHFRAFGKRSQRNLAWTCYYNVGYRCIDRGKRYAKKVWWAYRKMKKLSRRR